MVPVPVSAYTTLSHMGSQEANGGLMALPHCSPNGISDAILYGETYTNGLLLLSFSPSFDTLSLIVGSSTRVDGCLDLDHVFGA
jgi:hypothetical protein